MRILFYSRGFEQIGIEYLSAVLKRAGHDVELVFDPGFDDNTYVRLPFLKMLNREDRMIRRAREFAPDLIGFSCLSNLYPYISRMAGILKRETGAPVAVGGPHPSALPEFILSDKNVDMVCVGEAEDAVLELMERMEKGDDYLNTRNFWFKSNGKIVSNPVRPLHETLDDLPLPDREIYAGTGVFRRTFMVITSRGCPFNCSYCTHAFQRTLYKEHGYPIRRRSVSNVMEELLLYKQKYRAAFICFEDDDFASSLSWLEAFSERYSKEIGLPFYCLTSPAQTSEKKVMLLKRAGCRELFMGIDSGSETIRRDRLNRKFTNRELIQAARRIQDAGINLRCTAMFGIPDETPDEMLETIDLVTRIRPRFISTYTFYPYPRTKLFEYAREKGYIDKEIQQTIYSGKGSLRGISLLKLPHKKLALVFTHVLPLSNRLPRSWQPTVLSLCRHEQLYRVSFLFYYLFIPVTYPSIGLLRMRDMMHFMWKSLRPLRKSDKV